MYVADGGNSQIEELSPNGNGGYTQTTIASGFNQDMAVAVDTAGNVYVADSGNSKIDELSPVINGATQSFNVQPTITNLPSTAIVGGSFTPTVNEGNSSATTSVASTTPSVCRINQDGSVSYLSPGTCSLVSHAGYTQSSIGSGFNQAMGVAVDTAGNVYVADTFNNNVDKLSPNGSGAFTQTTMASGLNLPRGVVFDTYGTDGNTYVTSIGNNQVEAVSPLGVGMYNQTTIDTEQDAPNGIAIDASGNIYLAEDGNSYIEELSPDGSGGYGKTSIGSGFVNPAGVAVDASGNVYVADYGNPKVQELSPNGSGGYTQTSIGPGLTHPVAVAVDASGDIYVADLGSKEVDELSPNGSGGYAKTIIASGFSWPTGVAVDASGNVYVADSGNSQIDELSPVIGATQNFTIGEPTAPATPTAISAIAGNQSAVVSWSNPASNGDATAHNKVQYSTNGSTWTTASATISASATSYTVTGLTNGQAYHLRVIALDGSNNASAPDTLSSVVTPVAPPPRVVKPGAPTRASAATHGASVTVSWHAPSSNGGGAITYYKVSVSPSGKSCTTSKLTCSISGLSTKTGYSISITATNAAGTGLAATLSRVKG